MRGRYAPATLSLYPGLGTLPSTIFYRSFPAFVSRKHCSATIPSSLGRLRRRLPARRWHSRRYRIRGPWILGSDCHPAYRIQADPLGGRLVVSVASGNSSSASFRWKALLVMSHPGGFGEAVREWDGGNALVLKRRPRVARRRLGALPWSYLFNSE